MEFKVTPATGWGIKSEDYKHYTTKIPLIAKPHI